MSESQIPPDMEREESSTPDASDGAPQEAPARTKVDWRIIAIVCVAVLFLIAIYINRVRSRDREDDKTPQGSGATSQQASDRKPLRVRLTEEQWYRRLVQDHELRAKESIFTAKGRMFILAVPPKVKRNPDNPKEIVDTTLSRAFDVTQRLPGIEPWMFHRRQAYVGRLSPLFMDRFGYLGGEKGIRMVVKPGAKLTLVELANRERVIGIKVGDKARAYPIRFMNYHDVANDNDMVSGKTIAVAWSALAEAAGAMECSLDHGTVLSFGSAGLIYQGVNLLYDLNTESLWSPVMRKCVAGELAGKSLTAIQTTVTSWEAWKKMYPDTTVFVEPEPISHNYDYNPALPSPAYLRDAVYFYPIYGLTDLTKPMPMKARVFGVIGPDGKTPKAYELALVRQEKEPFEDKIGGKKVLLEYDPKAGVLTAKDAAGKSLRCESMFWFAWRGAHAATEVWKETELIEKFQPQRREPADISDAAKNKAPLAPASESETLKEP